jgi:hypothetical protein
MALLLELGGVSIIELEAMVSLAPLEAAGLSSTVLKSGALVSSSFVVWSTYRSVLSSATTNCSA